MSSKEIQKALKMASDAKKTIKEVQQMSKPAKQMMAAAVVISVTNWFKGLKTFDYNKKWHLHAVVEEGINYAKDHWIQSGNRKIKGPGIIIFKEKSTGLMSIASSADLSLYLPTITVDTASKGKFGKGPQAMEEFDVYYEMAPSYQEARKKASKLRSSLRREKLNK